MSNFCPEHHLSSALVSVRDIANRKWRPLCWRESTRRRQSNAMRCSSSSNRSSSTQLFITSFPQCHPVTYPPAPACKARPRTRKDTPESADARASRARAGSLQRILKIYAPEFSVYFHTCRLWMLPTSAPYMQHPPHTKHNHHHQLVTPRQCRHNVLREDKDRGRAQHTRERALLCRFFFCRFFSWTACEWLRQGDLHRLRLCPCPVLHLMTRPIETGRERARTLDASRNGEE